MIGLASALVDNVPLVAATMGMYDMQVYPQVRQSTARACASTACVASGTSLKQAVAHTHFHLCAVYAVAVRRLAGSVCVSLHAHSHQPFRPTKQQPVAADRVLVIALRSDTLHTRTPL